MTNLLGRKNIVDFDFVVKEVCEVMHKLTGNVFGEKQIPMVESRLKRRLRELKIEAPEDYITYWKNNRDTENKYLIGLMTTHFTSFFREFLHFEYIAEHLQELVQDVKKQGRSEIRIWSAACSKGHEVWSLAMWLNHHLPQVDPKMSFVIYGTDIDETSVKEGENGVYHGRELQTAPLYLWQNSWVKGQGEIAEWYKAKKVLRDRVKFGSANLLDLSPFKEQAFDIVLCRNVLIYFNLKDQEKAVKNLLGFLQPHGRLITGVSESLSSLKLGLKTEAPSVYTNESTSASRTKVEKKVSKESAIPKPLKVLCVDDSGTVLSILKKVLQGEDFIVVGTASNGAEAQSQYDLLKPDVVTLDLHMPTMDGFTLVNVAGFARKVPVVVVSSVERQNSDLVLPLFKNGVKDFVEKPNLENIKQIGEELQQKLKMAWWSSHRKLNIQNLDSLKSPALKSRSPGVVILNAGMSDRDAIIDTLSKHRGFKDDVRVFMQGQSHLWEGWANDLKTNYPDIKLKIQKANSMDIPSDQPNVILHFTGGDLSVINSSLPKKSYLIIEEGDWSDSIRRKAHDEFPASSFSYMAAKHLEGA